MSALRGWLVTRSGQPVPANVGPAVLVFTPLYIATDYLCNGKYYPQAHLGSFVGAAFPDGDGVWSLALDSGDYRVLATGGMYGYPREPAPGRWSSRLILWGGCLAGSAAVEISGDVDLADPIVFPDDNRYPLFVSTVATEPGPWGSPPWA